MTSSVASSPIAVSVAEAARRVGISETMYRRLVRAGLAPHVRLGTRRIVVPLDALAEWINSEARAHMWGGIQ